MPEYLQVEGIDRVLDNIVTRARATAVTTAPYVMEPAGEKRIPPRRLANNGSLASAHIRAYTERSHTLRRISARQSRQEFSR